MTQLLHALPAFLLAVSLPGTTVDDFQLKDQHGKVHSLSSFANSPVVVIAVLGTECPLAKLYGPRLQQFADGYAKQNVIVLGINANSQDSRQDIKAYARQHKIDFPILQDLDYKVVDQLGAERTPEVFVLDQSRRVQYRGRIDDQYGVGYVREKVTRFDLRIAVEELLDGNPVSNPITDAVGCIIGRVREAKSSSSITYCDQISRVFAKHCLECHHRGDIGPFQMTEYNEVVGWAETIAEVIRDQRMPPWHANPKHGTFSNARRMTAAEKQLVYDWVQAGTPFGDKDDLPAPRKFIDGWRLPKEPDAVFAMSRSSFRVPAEGTIDYQYFTVDPGFKEDKWISAAEVVPGNRSVVHHSIVSAKAPDAWGEKAMSWLAAYVPGQEINQLKPHQAFFVPAGSKLVFQMHYTPTGRQETDITKIGIVFADPQDIREMVFTKIAMNRRFVIPPNTSDHRVAETLKDFPKGARLLTLSPHMHLRGKSFQVIAYRGEHSKILLDVPNYDSNWQHTYRLEKPLALDSQTRIVCVAHYDNSQANIVNPDPTASVRWGEQQNDEMMLAYCGIAFPVNPSDIKIDEPAESKESRIANKAVDRFFKRFDKDKNDRILESELPDSFRQFAFRDFDANKDGAIDRTEAKDEAMKSLRKKQKNRSRFGKN